MWATRILPLLMLLLLLLTVSSGAESRNDAQLKQIPQLSHEQVALIAANATARCLLVPQLCDWQLHLYEGHAFQVNLPKAEHKQDEQLPSHESTEQLLFTVPNAEYEQTLLIYAQVEHKSKLNVKARSKSKSKSRKRKRRLMSTN